MMKWLSGVQTGLARLELAGMVKTATQIMARSTVQGRNIQAFLRGHVRQ